jgi:hypothetical protein
MTTNPSSEPGLTCLRDCWACGTGMDYDQQPPRCLACGAIDPCGNGPAPKLGKAKEQPVRHFFRVLWLRGAYWPICRVRFGLRDAWRAYRRKGWTLVQCEELIRLTTPLDEHPDEYDGPCNCATCRSYADG